MDGVRYNLLDGVFNMTKSIIDPSEEWFMRIARDGSAIEDGPPYLFSGDLEPLVVHQSGVLTDIWRFYVPAAYWDWNDLKHAHYSNGYSQGMQVNFPDLGYVPQFWFMITSDDDDNRVTFPFCHDNYITYSSSRRYAPTVAKVTATASTSYLRFGGGTLDYQTYGGPPFPAFEEQNGAPWRQGDLYYIVFKNREVA